MKIARRPSSRGRVEIIPMIDTILILLIFFMSFSTFDAKEQSIASKIPSRSPGGPTDRTAPSVLQIVLQVRNAREIVVAGTVYDPAGLRDVLALLGNQPVEVVIEAEPDTTYQAVITALDACAQAKLTRVGFREPASKPAGRPA